MKNTILRNWPSSASTGCCNYTVAGIGTQAEIDAIADATRSGNRYFVTDAGAEKIIQYSADGASFTEMRDRTESFYFEDSSQTPSLLYYWSVAENAYRPLDQWTYHPARTYPAGIIQRDPATGIEYTSQQAGNQGNALTDAAWWQPTTQATTQLTQEWFSDQLYGGHYPNNQHRGVVANGYLYLGFVNAPSHDAYVTRCNLATKVWDTPVMVAASALADTDDHGNPGIAISPTGIIHLIFDSHGTTDWIHRRSINPYDITAWETPTNLPAPKRGTYPQLHFLSDGSLLFFRRRSNASSSQHKANWGVSVSTDNGDNWGTYTPLLFGDSGSDPDEAKYAQSYVLPNDELAIAWAWLRSDDPQTVNPYRRNAYYVTWSAANGLRDIQGNTLTAPLTIADADLVTNSAQVADFGEPFTSTTWPQNTLSLPLLFINAANDPIVYYTKYSATNTAETHIHTWSGTAWTDAIAVTVPIATLTAAGYADQNVGLNPLLTQAASGEYQLFTHSPTGANLARFTSNDLTVGNWTEQEIIYDNVAQGNRWYDLNAILNHTDDTLAFFTNIDQPTDNGRGYVWGLDGFLNPGTADTGASNFFELTDTPSASAAIANQFLRVDGAGNAVEAFALPLSQSWQPYAIADSPVTLTHGARAALDLTGTTAIAPLVVNIELPALTEGQVGEIRLSDVLSGDTWSSGFLSLVITDGAGGQISTTLPDFTTPGNQVTAADGLVTISNQAIGDGNLVLRYVGGSAQIRFFNGRVA